MSVNEVKLHKAAEPFVVRGAGPPSSRTFCIGDEDHTLGNSIRHVLMQNPNVGFAGYSVPHPSEPVVQIRVQTIPDRSRDVDDDVGNTAPTAATALKVACHTLSSQCDIILQRLEQILPEVQEDRLNVERIRLEETYEEEEEEGGAVEQDQDEEIAEE